MIESICTLWPLKKHHTVSIWRVPPIICLQKISRDFECVVCLFVYLVCSFKAFQNFPHFSLKHVKLQVAPLF